MNRDKQRPEGQQIRTLLYQMEQRKDRRAHDQDPKWEKTWGIMIGGLMATARQWWNTRDWSEQGKWLSSLAFHKTSASESFHMLHDPTSRGMVGDESVQGTKNSSSNLHQWSRHPQSEGEGIMNSILSKNFSWGIATKLVVLFAIFGIVPMAAVGYLGSSATGEMEKASGQRVQNVATNIADKIDRNLFERYGDPQSFGLNRIVGERYHWYSKENNAIANAMNQYVTTSGIYYLTIMVDPVGDVMAVNSKDAKGNPVDTTPLYSKKYADAPWFKALQAKEYTTKQPFTAPGNDVVTGTFIEDLHVDEDVKSIYPGDDGLTLGFSAPVYIDGDLIGYWSNRVKFSLVEEIVQTAYQELKSSGYPGTEITVLGGNGQVIVDYDPSSQGKEDITHDLENTLLTLNLAEKGVEAAKFAVAGKTGYLFGAHVRKGIDQLAGYTHLKGALGYPGMNWSVLVRIPKDQAAATAIAFNRNLTMTAIICVALILVVGLWVGRRGAASIIQVSQVAQRAAEGDLTARVTVSSKDELGMLGSAMNVMLDNIANVVGEVRQAADHVSTASSEITQGNEDLSQRTSAQAGALEETSASMEEMTSTIKQNADNAKQANQLAVTAREVAEKGGAVTDKAVNAMDEINKSSKKIADIINVIDEIAFQTNLLALNAAVEAARAGEQGRGFAVVASEVRNLAQRSATAAKEIKTLINESVEKVGDGSALVNQSGQTLSEIVNSVKRVTDIIAEISAASQEQASGIDQVNKAVMQMDQGTQQNAALVEEATSASQSMKQQAGALLEQVAFFKIPEASSGLVSRAAMRPTSGSRPTATPKVKASSSAKEPVKAAPQPVGVGSGNGKSASKGDDAFFEEF
ncbi:MAG: methyl-accepting chemotaxis protein [Nitrospirales bacterium]